MRQKRAKGEIVEVGGGRLVRSLGRKDRHSKVCTAKGPKDRRVRLSANTAIRFYDVQDRLGYDRPSKAIDWLMKEAKGAIEALYDHELPATISNTSTIAVTHPLHQTAKELEEYKSAIHAHQETPENGIHNEQSCSDIQKDSTFGVFNNYPESLNLRNRSQAQELALSLQSFQENQLLLQGSLFSALSPLDFEGTMEMIQFEEMVTWDPNASSDNGKESAQGFAINSLPRHLEPFSGQNQIFSQREPLQSSFLPSIHAASIPATNSYGTAFANDEFLEFSFYPQIQGREEDEDNLVSSQQLSYGTSLMHYQDF